MKETSQASVRPPEPPESGSTAVASVIREDRPAQNLGWSALSDGVERLFQLGGVIFFARVLGAGAFGILSTAQSLVNVLGMMTDAGTSTHGMRECSRAGATPGRAYSDLASLRLLIALLALAALGLTPVLPAVLDGHRDVLLAAGAYLLVLALQPDWVLRGLERFRPLALSMLIGFGVAVGVVALAIRSADDLLLAAGTRAIFYGTAAMLMLVTGAFAATRPLPRPRPDRWKRHLGESLPIAGIQVAQTLTLAAPILLLGSLAQESTVGHFAAAHRLTVAIASTSLVLVRPFFASFARIGRRDRSTLRSAHRPFEALFFVVAAPLLVGGLFTAEGLLRLLFGAEYAAAAPIFRLLLGGATLAFVRPAYGSVLIAVGLQRPCLRAQLAGSALTLVALGLGWTLAGPWGIALGMLVGEALTLFLVWITFALHLSPALPGVRVLARVGLALLFMIVALLLMPTAPTLLRILAAGGVYGLVGWALSLPRLTGLRKAPG